MFLPTAGPDSSTDDEDKDTPIPDRLAAERSQHAVKKCYRGMWLLQSRCSHVLAYAPMLHNVEKEAPAAALDFVRDACSGQGLALPAVVIYNDAEAVLRHLQHATEEVQQQWANTRYAMCRTSQGYELSIL